MMAALSHQCSTPVSVAQNLKKFGTSSMDIPNPDYDKIETVVPKKRPHILPKESPGIQSQGDQLCGRCRTINLDEIFFSKISAAEGRMIMPLGEITGEMEDSSCPLCRLFAAVRISIESKVGYKNRGHHLRAFEISPLEAKVRGKGKDLAGSKVVLGVMKGLSMVKIQIAPDDLYECFAHGVIAAVPASERLSDRKGGLEAHVVEPTGLNYGQLREWINNCQKYHHKSCAPDSPHPLTALTCIDCFTRNLVQINSCEKYFTLSYV
ncbi:MAG: hypothetical protein Q9227_000958 [Pyrenula ochraceoflavens]